MARNETADRSRDAAAATPMRWLRGWWSQRPGIPPSGAAIALEHASDGVLIADMRQRGHPIVQVNPAFETITGYPAAEAIGKNCRYLQGSDRLQPEIGEMRAALEEGRPCSVTLRNYRRDGTPFRNALRLVPLHDDAGEATHFIGLIRDVTHAAGIDRLTGLLDRYGLLDRLTAIGDRRAAKFSRRISCCPAPHWP